MKKVLSQVLAFFSMITLTTVFFSSGVGMAESPAVAAYKPLYEVAEGALRSLSSVIRIWALTTRMPRR